ncbi:carbohydrate ABC transporter permease [Paenibacillus psychroresistens]|uniref:Carbohydrate ABC transporter permease n=1 Tax=Paenibacillus psychroresistens TaxID=1778678 RepID=A0A6B8RT31_9BACL|nr:carbohydrate ABC transporter permease [Paenibacillus psychroresistens]QGQ99069.1 carbohydrate ABC transporter permease [Paenibacillus psychroresistens]
MGRLFPKCIPHIILMTYVIVVIYPLFFILTASFKINSNIILHPWGLPKPLIIQNYIDALSNNLIGRYFWNSLSVATIATALSILLAVTIAYALTRMKFPLFSKIVYGILLLALLIPPASLLIPLYIMVKDLGLYNSHLALILPYSSFGIPLTVFVIAAFLKSIPTELEEAGIMDGLSAYGLLGRIIIPLTLPTLVTVFILNFLSNWNEYIMASLFLSNQLLRTLPVAIVSFSDKFNMNYGALCASVMVSVIPVILIFIFLQKQIIEGVTSGSIKG